MIKKNKVITPAKGKDAFITIDKIFSHLDVVNKWIKGRSVYPITVEIHLTELCNNRCFYCHYPKSPKTMSLANAKVAIEKLSSIGTKALILSGGGEPTLHPDVKKVIRAIAKEKIESAIITNLLKRDNELYSAILKHCTWCRISLDSSGEAIYKRIRGVFGFRNVIANIRKLVKLKNQLKAKTTIGIQAVVNRYNINDIFRQIKLASDLGVDYIQIRPVETMPGEKIAYSKKQYDHIMQQIETGYQFERSNFKVIRSNKWDLINPYLKQKAHGFYFCHAYMMIAAIDVYGDMYVCCHQIETKNKDMCYGNILKEPISNIMSRRKKIIKNLDLKKCYLECRASNVNRRLQSLKNHVPHGNFL